MFATSLPAASDPTRRIAHSMVHQCVAVRARRLSRVVTRAYEAALRPMGITLSQLSLLAAIAAMGPLPAARVGRMLDLEKSTLSRNLALMQVQGWLVAEPELRVTGAGRRLLRGAEPRWRAVQERMERALGADATSVLQRLAGAAQGVSNP